MSSAPEPDVEVRWLEDYVFVGGDGVGHTVVFDAPEEAKVAVGVSPMKALLMCLGACSGMDVVATLGKRKQSLTALKISVQGVRPEHGYPKPFSSISIRYRLTGRRLDERFVSEAVGESIQKYCGVAATIDGRAKIDFGYEIVEADA